MTRSTISRARLRGVRLVAATASALLVVAMLPGATSAAGTIVFDGSPGISPPPATLGGYPMTPFGPDGASLFSYIPSVPAPGSGVVGFSEPLQVYPPGSLSGGWTAGYTGNTYLQDPNAPLVLTLPANTKAFYLYAEHNLCGTYTITATANDGTTSGPVVVGPVCSTLSARYYGFYVTGGATLSTITLTNGAYAYGLIVGEFGINTGAAPAPKPTDPPVVLGISPGGGPVGSFVTITGTSFTYARSVTFNGVPASFTVRSPNIIVATVPAGPASGQVRVTTPFGTTLSVRSFRVLP